MAGAANLEQPPGDECVDSDSSLPIGHFGALEGVVVGSVRAAAEGWSAVV